MIRKSDLKNGMIVKSSDGRYGVVCLKDATDENCIKFFYDPNLTVGHGSVESTNCGDFIVSLDQFTEDLKYICSEKEARYLGLIEGDGTITLWSIKEVFSLRREWTRLTCVGSCGHLDIRKDSCDQQAVGYCKLKGNYFVGTMEDIHAGAAYCVAENEYFKKRSGGVQGNVESKSNTSGAIGGDTKKLRWS